MELTSSEINSLLKGAEAILWDFDGVLLDSMSVRDDAFRHALDAFSQEQIESLLCWHRANGGLSRYVKFRFFQKEVLNQPIAENLVQEWASKFSDYCSSNLGDTSKLIEPTIRMVHSVSGSIPMHIVSGSDCNELRRLCDQLGISGHFLSIEGSPTSKPELVAGVIENHRYTATSVWLIGDSHNDYEAASSNSIRFVGTNNPSLVGIGDHYWDLNQSAS